MKIIVGSTRIQGAKAIIENAVVTTFSDVLKAIKDNVPAFELESFSSYHTMGSYIENETVNTFAIKTGKLVSGEVATVYDLGDRVPQIDTLKIALSPIKMDGGELELTEEEKKYILETSGLAAPSNKKLPAYIEEDNVDTEITEVNYEDNDCEEESTLPFNPLDFLLD